MSLIIDMLKDLDNRQNKLAPELPIISRTQHSNYFNKWSKLIFLALSTIICIAIISYLYTHKRTITRTLILPAETPVIKSAQQQANTDDAILNPVNISGISFEAKNEATDITFQLSHDTLYRLVTSDNNNILYLYIDHATMESDLPTIIGADVGIQSITSMVNDGNIKFAITLKPNAFLNSVSLNNDTKSTELVVSIGNPILPQREILKTSAGIKSPAIQSIIIDQYEAAVKLAETGNKPEAIIRLSKLLKYYPDYNDARVALAAIVLETGNSIQARKIIDDGLALSPDYLPLVELKARILTSEGKINEALMVLQSEHPAISDAPNYHALIAALYSRENNHQLSAAIYQKLVQLDPHEGNWWFGLGVSLDKLGRNQDAIYAYTKAATEGRINTQAVAFLHTRLQTLQETTPHAAE